jgi:hypothetical protein
MSATAQFGRAAAETPDSITASVSTTIPRAPITATPTSLVTSVATTSVVVTTSVQPTTTSTPQADPRAAIVAGINRALDACEAAWARMDSANMAVCGTTLANSARQQLRSGLVAAQSLKIEGRRITEQTAEMATVACQLTFRSVSKRDGRELSTSSQGIIMLRRQNDGWTITSYQISR